MMADGGSTTARRRRVKGPTTVDPIEIAMESEGGGAGQRLLVKQEKLVGWQIASERAGFALKLLTGAAGLAAAVALGVMVWNASRADGVILEPFTVPAALQAEGVSGEVVASQVLDELSRLRAQTVQPGEARDYANDWGRSIKVAIPATGISLGELDAALRQWLGHETRISGEVYRSPAGLALRARAPGRPGVRVEGPASDLEGSAQALARLIYGETQPLRYAAWLSGQDRFDEALRIIQPIALGAGPLEQRTAAFEVWTRVLNNRGDAAGAVAIGRRAIALNPTRSDLWWGVAINENNLSHLESALAAYREVVRLRPKDRSLPPEWRDAGEVAAGNAATLQGDFHETLKQTAAAAKRPMLLQSEGVQLDVATMGALTRLHDVHAARARLAAPEHLQPWQEARNHYQLTQSRVVLGYYAEDWAEVLAGETAFMALPVRYADRGHNAIIGFIGVAHAMTGDAAGARAIFDSLAPDCDACMVIKARGLAKLGEAAEADRLLAQVQARAPSIGMPVQMRGRVKLEAGDAAGALPLFVEAARRSPKWADPIEGQGEALLALRRPAEAEAAFAKAAAITHKWGRLHMKWGEALAAQGKAQAAKAAWTTAAGLYLTAAERVELSRLQGAR